MKPLTKKEQDMYEYIIATINKDGYSPSVRDIRAALGIRSTSTVHQYLQRLEDKGYIQKEQGKSRTLRVGGAGGAGNSRIPILGRVAAGEPIFAEENYDGHINIEVPPGYDITNLFALRVDGQSMVEAGILSGDIIIVNKTPYAENGEIIVALVDDEATVKTFYKENGGYRLQPENYTMRPILLKEVAVLGRVIASVRYYSA